MRDGWSLKNIGDVCKTGAGGTPLKSQKEYYMLEGKAQWTTPPSFATYEDHRMAMAFAPLALLAPIIIEEPKVVGKSYPDFWKDLAKLGFEVG